MIKFSKTALDIRAQLDKLIERGLIVSDESEAMLSLTRVGYYRLSGYMVPLQIGGQSPGNHVFKPNTTFVQIMDRYTFDRSLRLIVMDAIERIEIAFKAALCNSMSVRFGPHWYCDDKHFSSHQFNHDDLLDDIKRQINHNDVDRKKRHSFIHHYYSNYDDPEMPPCWMIFEAVSFGCISKAFKNLTHQSVDPICKDIGLIHTILSSWLHSTSYIRNLCAHHSLLWNRVCTIKPVIANAYRPDLTPNDRAYAQIVVMQILLDRLAPDPTWAQKLVKLFDDHPAIKPEWLGFPIDWKNRPIWASSGRGQQTAPLASPHP